MDAANGEQFGVAVDSVNLDSFIRLGESLDELEVTIGPAARPVIAEVRTRLAAAAGIRLRRRRR